MRVNEVDILKAFDRTRLCVSAPALSMGLPIGGVIINPAKPGEPFRWMLVDGRHGGPLWGHA